MRVKPVLGMFLVCLAAPVVRPHRQISEWVLRFASWEGTQPVFQGLAFIGDLVLCFNGYLYSGTEITDQPDQSHQPQFTDPVAGNGGSATGVRELRLTGAVLSVMYATATGIFKVVGG